MVLRKDFDLDAWLTAWKLGVEQTWSKNKPDEVVAMLNLTRGLPFTAPELFPARAREAWTLFDLYTPDCPELRAAVALAYIILSAIETKPAPSKGG